MLSHNDPMTHHVFLSGDSRLQTHQNSAHRQEQQVLIVNFTPMGASMIVSCVDAAMFSELATESDNVSETRRLTETTHSQSATEHCSPGGATRRMYAHTHTVLF